MGNRNLAILLTPPGRAAIAVVRLCGPGVEEFLRRHFSRKVPVGRCVHGTLRDGEEIVDDPVVVWAGEAAGRNVADVNLHGGPWVVRWMLELARKNGFMVYDKPGDELPVEAVDEAGLEGEVMMALPRARTELALRRLLEQGGAWAAFRERAARGPEGEIEKEVERIVADRSLWRLLHPPRVVIVGWPNAGKSTLANQLFAQERSITADLPGTTRDWVGELANVDGLAVWLIDTPGWRQTPDEVEAQAIAGSREEAAAADLVLLVIDATVDRERQMVQMREGLGGQRKIMEVVNKCDLGQAPGGALQTVASSGRGIDVLRREIREYFGCGEDGAGRPGLWSEGQRERLVDAKQKGELGKVFA